MGERSKDGRETWRRLLAWDKGQAAAERLSGHVLRIEGFESLDPSHPLGGPDGLKDIACSRGGKKWIGAAYFPRGQQSFRIIKDKVEVDSTGIEKNSAAGIAFVTNQELTLGERYELGQTCGSHEIEILHLERIASILDSPLCYGLRLEFLDIEMTKEEQLAFIAQRDVMLGEMKSSLDTLLRSLKESPPGSPDSEMPVVSPRSLEHNSYSIFGPRAHECLTCHGVYLVASSRPNEVYLSGGMRVITCPYCGRNDRYY